MAFDIMPIHKAMYDRAVANISLVTSFMTDKELKRYGNPTSTNRPNLPWLVYSYEPISGSSNNIRVVNAGLWGYIDPDKDNTKLLYDIVSQIDTYFGSQSKRALSALGGDLGILSVGKPLIDDSMGGLVGIVTRVQFSRRG